MSSTEIDDITNINNIVSPSENDEQLNKLIELDKKSRKRHAVKPPRPPKSLFRPDDGLSNSVVFDDSSQTYQSSIKSPNFGSNNYIGSSMVSNSISRFDEEGYKKSYPLLCDLDDEFDLPVFSNMSDARKTFEGFIEANLRFCKNEKMCKLMMKFVKVLADFPKKELKWLQLYYTLLTLPKDTSETMRVQLQQQLATTREWKVRSNYDSNLDPKNKHKGFHGGNSNSSSSTSNPNFQHKESRPAAFPLK